MTKRKLLKVVFNAILYCTTYCICLLFVNCSSSGSGGGENNGETTEITPSPGMDVYGFIGDAANNPIAGVVVSDGYQCVKTNAKGVYEMKRNSNAKFVYYSTPSEYKINTSSSSNNTAVFYKTLSASTKRYDFTLAKLPGGVETNFTLIAIGDPQVSARTNDPYYTAAGVKSTSATYSNLWRFKNETMVDISETLKSATTPVYGLVMGDICDDGAASLQGSVRAALGSTSMPVFSVIGNHDKVSNGTTRTTSQYENAWGPLNYSFNRGNVHFVALDNVLFSDAETYTGGFTDAQVDWLKQDLSYVSKSMMVVLYYHIPLRNTTSYANRNTVLGLLSGFANYSLFCGHTHYNEVCSVTSPISTLEHIHAAACGAWWKSTLNTEGTPNGYEVYTVGGTQFTNWYYKSVGRDKSFQMRLSEANQAYGGTYGYYNYATQLSLQENAGYVVANIFNADKNWTVKAYEGASTIGVTMAKALNNADAYAMGYHVGTLNRDVDNYNGSNTHAYYYKRTDPNAVVKVIAIDEFGNQYTANTFIKDFTEAMHY